MQTLTLEEWTVVLFCHITLFTKQWSSANDMCNRGHLFCDIPLTWPVVTRLDSTEV